MPAIAAIKASTIVDYLTSTIYTADADVGVDTTLSPDGFIAPGVVRWVDRSGGIAIGYPTVTLGIRPPTKASRVYKITVKVVLPTLEQTSASTATGIQPAPTKAYDCTAVLEFMLPERSTQAERKALFSMVRSMLAYTINASDGSPSDQTGSPVYAAVTDFESVY